MTIDLMKGKVINSEEEKKMEVFEKRKDNLGISRTEAENPEREISWTAPQYEFYEKSKTWYMVAGVIILAMVAFAVYKNSPIMAITFILIAIVGYINLQREPETIEFFINFEGIRAGRQLYAFDNIKSFWIFYDPPHTKSLSLHIKEGVMPYIHIPIGDEDPVEIRDILLEFIPEVQQDPNLIDSLARILHI